MATIISLTTGGQLGVDRAPDACPICHCRVLPQGIAYHMYGQGAAQHLEIFFRCPAAECARSFIGTYDPVFDRGNPKGWAFGRAYPKTPLRPPVAEEVAKLSPAYLEILSQASAAESYGLDEVSGVAYRKALEFLVKDFAIHTRPEKADEIKAAFLGVCISSFVDDANVKECARRATWLGNDETHYVRKWGNKDLNDLKKLLRLTEAWVLNSLLTKAYLEDMRT